MGFLELDSLKTRLRFTQFELAVVLLGAASFLKWVSHDPTAFEWPALDLAPLWMAWSNPHVLVNDFFTQASQIPNPRWVFAGMIHIVSGLISSNWYSVMFVTKAIVVVLTPISYFLFVWRATTPTDEKGTRQPVVMWVAFFAIFFLLFESLRAQLAVAWWQPIRLDVHPN